jgi:hypothetical protein
LKFFCNFFCNFFFFPTLYINQAGLFSSKSHRTTSRDKKRQTSLSFALYATVLHSEKAPRESVKAFCGLVGDSAEVFAVAMRCEIYEEAVRACKELKDQVGGS